MTKIKFKKRSLYSLPLVLIIILVIVSGVLGYTTYHFYHRYQDLKNDSNLMTKEETDNLVREVAKLMDLPPGEAPTVATVLDKEKLKDQSFFKNAENGDKILIYTGANKAILYRPDTHKIIEVLPLTVGEK